MRTCFLVVLMAMVAGCGQTPVPEQRADKLAKSLCQCTQDLLELNKKAESAPDSLAFQSIAQAFNKARTCALGLGIKQEEKPVLETALNAYCPELIKYPDLLQELLSQ
jgi:hypothetical protein